MKYNLRIWALIFSLNGLFAGQYGYVADSTSNRVSIIDIETNTVIGYVNNGGFDVGNPLHVLTTPDGTKVYIVTNSPDAVFIMDPTQSTIVGKVNDSVFPFVTPTAQIITPDGLKSYVTNESIDQVSIIDVQRDVVIGYVELGSGFYFNQPIDVDCVEDGTRVYVTNYGDTGSGANEVALVNTATDTLEAYVSTGSHVFDQPINVVCFGPSGNQQAYVSNYGSNTIGYVDNTSSLNQYVTDAGSLINGPRNLFMSQDETLALVCNFGNNTVSRIDVGTTAVTENISGTFNGPDGLHITADNAYAYVSNLHDNTVSIIDLNLNQVIGVVNDFAYPFIGPSDLEIGNPFINPVPQPPISLKAVKKKNRFASQVDLIDVITWEAPLAGISPALYRIYRDASLQDLAATIPATDVLQYIDHNRQKGSVNPYYIVGVDTLGEVSEPAEITVTW